ncbi:MAG: deoxycytidine deaminase, partial [Cyanobacteria bacterium J06632_19]
METLESISLSKEIGGTIHSMVSKAVLQGLSHISTTVDPGWSGKLLISIHNYRDCSLILRFQDSFCTLCFYKVESESKVSLGRPSDRDDICQAFLDNEKEEEDKQARENLIKTV